MRLAPPATHVFQNCKSVKTGWGGSIQETQMKFKTSRIETSFWRRGFKKSCQSCRQALSALNALGEISGITITWTPPSNLIPPSFSRSGEIHWSPAALPRTPPWFWGSRLIRGGLFASVLDSRFRRSLKFLRFGVWMVDFLHRIDDFGHFWR